LQGKKPGKTTSLPTEVRYYTFQAQINSVKPKGEGDVHRVFSEHALPYGLGEKLHELHQTFSKFRDNKKPLDPIVILGFKTATETPKHAEQEAHYEAKSQMVIMPSTEVFEPETKNNAEMTAAHELTHSILHNSALSGKVFEKAEALHNEHNQVLKKFGKEALIESEFMKVFRESTYIKTKTGEKSLAGHPWDNENELFASALSTLRYFSSEFIAEFNKLNPEDKKIAEAFLNKVLDFLTSINSDPKDLKALLPEIEKIRADIK
jgi:hypothetical protein